MTAPPLTPSRVALLTGDTADTMQPNDPIRFERALHLGVCHTPAEVLDPFDRRLLILRLREWTVAEIANHTGWTEYTVTRLRRDVLGTA